MSGSARLALWTPGFVHVVEAEAGQPSLDFVPVPSCHLVSRLGGGVLAPQALGVPPSQVEPLAFAWLAMRCVARLPGSLPAVTGASAERVLGAIYPR